jgi:histidinol-phosphate aminotransferase
VSVADYPEVARERSAPFPGYRPGRAARDPAGKLSSNEAALGPAPAVLAAIGRVAPQAHRYPDAGPLRRLIAAEAGLAPERVIVTNGSDELCYLVASLFVEPGAKVVLSEPCYQIDELVSRLYRGVVAPVRVRADGGQDLEAMRRHSQDASLVWLPTPHNPTGVAADPDELELFLDGVPPSCLVVLDEAYRAYVDPDRRPRVRALLRRHPNLIVQRTFSKDYALAGLRVGYGLADPAVIEAIERIRPPFSVNAVAIAAAEVAVRHRAWRDYGVELAVRERRELEATLSQLGVTYFPSQANFVTFRPSDPDALLARLFEAGLAVRDGADLGLPGWLRVSIGTPPAMARLRAVLKEVL